MIGAVEAAARRLCAGVSPTTRAKLGQKASEGGKVLVDPSALENLFDAIEQSNPGYLAAHAQAWKRSRR